MKKFNIIPFIFAAALAASGAAVAADIPAPVQVAQAGEGGDNRNVTFGDLRHVEDGINRRMDEQGRELTMLREDVTELRENVTELRAEVNAQGRDISEMRLDIRALNNTLLGILAALLAACVGIALAATLRGQRAATAATLFFTVVIPVAIIFAVVALPEVVFAR